MAESSRHKQQRNFCLLRMHAQAALITLNHLSSSAANCNLRHKKNGQHHATWPLKTSRHAPAPSHIFMHASAPVAMLFAVARFCSSARGKAQRIWRSAPRSSLLPSRLKRAHPYSPSHPPPPAAVRVFVALARIGASDNRAPGALSLSLCCCCASAASASSAHSPALRLADCSATCRALSPW